MLPEEDSLPAARERPIATSKDNFLYRVFFLLGCGTLFPYNAFITAADYFDSLYPGRHTDRLITVSYLPIMLLALTAIVLNRRRPPRRVVIVAGLSGFLISMSIIPLWGAAAAGSLPLPVVLFFVAVTGVSDAFVQCAVFGEAALLPERFTQALVSGTAASGAAVSVLRIITKAALPHTATGLRHSAELYFLSAALVVGLCLYMYSRVLQRMPLYLHYLKRAEGPAGARWLLPEEYPRSAGDPPSPVLRDATSTDSELPHAVPTSNGDFTKPSVESPQDGAGDVGQTTGQENMMVGLEVEEGTPLHAHGAAYVVVWKARWRMYLALMFIYAITLSIFPGFLAEDVSSSLLTDWYPVLLIAAFNFADLAGKELPAWGCWPEPSESFMVTGALSRLAFVPAFYVAARMGAGPPVLGSLTLALGVSNGYLTAVIMMACPRSFSGLEAEVAGNVSILSLVVGLCIGAAASFLWLL